MRINSIRYSGCGKLHEIAGKKLGVVHLKGTPHQVGLQYGKAFSQDLVDFNRSLKNMFAEQAGGFLSKIIYFVVLCYSFIQWMIPRRIPKPLKQEIKGIAKGAKGLGRFRLAKMIRLSGLYDFMVNFALAGFGCSSFAAKDKDGDLLVGRNFDMIYDPSGTLDRSRLILFEIEGQRPFISAGPVFFNLAPTTTIIKGEKGEPLFFGINNVTGPRKVFGKPTVTLLREMADRSGYAEIVDLLKKSKETCSKKFLISDGTDAAMAEVVPGKMTVVREIREGESNVVATNNYQTKKSKKFESKAELLHALNLNSWIRYRRIKRLIKEILAAASSREPHELAIRVLSDHFDLARNLCQPWGDNISPPYKNSDAYLSQTYVSAVMDYKNNLFWMGYGPYSAHGDFYGFSPENLWKWAREEEALEVRRYAQSPNYGRLELGRELTIELRKGKQSYKEEAFLSAADHFGKVLETDPEHIEAALLLGAIKLDLFDQAGYGSKDIASDLQRIIDIEDKYKVETRFRRGSAFAHLLLGMFYDLQRKREEAIKNYEKVLSYEKENALWSEASDWARKFLHKPCQDLLPHKKMVELLL